MTKRIHLRQAAYGAFKDNRKVRVSKTIKPLAPKKAFKVLTVRLLTKSDKYGIYYTTLKSIFGSM